jgi:hypothetical protein
LQRKGIQQEYMRKLTARVVTKLRGWITSFSSMDKPFDFKSKEMGIKGDHSKCNSEIGTG